MMLVKSVNSWPTLRITAPKLLHRAEKMDGVKQQNVEVVEKHSCQKKQEKAKQNIAQVYVITAIKQFFQKLKMNVNFMINWESKTLRQMARGQDCLINSPMCNHNRDTVVLCHGRKGKGMALKACDSDAVFGCSGCNYYTDQSGAPREEIEAYWESAKLRMAVRMQQIAQSVTGWKFKQIETANKWLKLNEGEI